MTANFHATTLPVSSGVDYPFGFHYHGNRTWYVQRSDAGNFATSYLSPGPTVAAETGAEYTDNSAHTCAQDHILAYVVSGTTSPHYRWYDSYSHATEISEDLNSIASIPSTSPPYMNHDWTVNGPC